jgi:glycosyltransferase involved in cell wall biosynthesis
MGGCERLSIDLAAHYAKSRGETQVALFYSPAGDGAAWTEFQEIGVETVSLPYSGRKLAFVRELKRLCRGRRVEHVLTHGFGMHLLIAVAAKLAGARSVLALVGNPPPTDAHARKRTRNLAHLARPLVKREIACSDYVRQRMIDEYWLPASRVMTIHNWVRVDEITRLAKRAREQRRSTGESAGPVVIMVARLDPIKDHATVIRATALLRDKFPNLRLRLVGDGPNRRRLESIAAEQGVRESVEFVGARNDIPEQLGGADLFVYSTTRDEGFGIVLAEAMAAGLPIVCTDVGPCREVLDQGRAGALVEPGSAPAMADAIGNLLRDRRSAEALGSAGLLFAQRNYTVTGAARQFDSLLGWRSNGEQQRVAGSTRSPALIRSVRSP